MESFVKEIRHHLKMRLIPFWEGLRDEEYGGYYGYMDYDLHLDKQYEKGCILNSRILWFFSNAYRLLKKENLREDALHAYRFLKEHCLDREYGGVFWSVTYDGQIKDDTKHTYNQAFAIYALSSYYDAVKDEEALGLAKKLMDLIETKCTDSDGYYLEAFTRDYGPTDNEKLSENGVMAEKTMNTLLHVFEAYTELYRVSHEEKVADRLRFMMDTMAEKIYDPSSGRQEVFFDKDWNSLIDLYSYGHDIETAWLIDRGVEVLGDSRYEEKMSPITKEITKHIYERAFYNGALMNEAENGVQDKTRVWWVQAEGIVGFVNGYQRNRQDAAYLRAAQMLWEYIAKYLIDPRDGGEWFWSADENDRPVSRPIVEPWKCPYHNGRMCIEVIQRLGGESMIHNRYYAELEKYEKLIRRNNQKSDFYNGIYDRYEYPVLTRDHIPLHWRYDLNAESNPYFMERLGVNAVMNSGAIELDGKYYLVVRIEGNDRKSFFAVAESDNGVSGFRFWDYPVVLPDTCPEETNVYDMRLTKHEDGYIYGVFCSESKDREDADLSAAVAQAGIVRTRDLKTWERLDNLITLKSPQQRNVALHPEFVDGKYAFYTRPMDGFIETGSGGGIGFGLCEDIEHAVIEEEKIISPRIYHTLTESKNGAGAVPIRGRKCWIHIAHGVRNTAAGLRYVLYAFGTDLEDPSKVIAEPSGVFLVPLGKERVGDVSNVVFTNGAIARENGDVYIYYASCDTRMHVASTTIEKLEDYLFHTPKDPRRSPDCVKQRCELIDKNMGLLKKAADEKRS